ncbi:MAG: NADH-quinone oxidoreductase subunit C [Thermoplasmata archaeon]|nr:NADH-quinone oxidoreductase subunit C [Thermoplasmata archaeon]
MMEPAEADGKIKRLTGEEIVSLFRERLGDGVVDTRVDVYTNGVRKKPFESVWIRVKRENFRDAVKLLAEVHSPLHISVASGSDIGDEIELIYHFQVYWGMGGGQISVSIGSRCPKSDPRFPSVSDLVPGAIITEREKQEFLGVVMEGIPDGRQLFLSESLPPDVHPWRKDEEELKKLEKYIRNVHDEGV